VEAACWWSQSARLARSPDGRPERQTLERRPPIGVGERRQHVYLVGPIEAELAADAYLGGRESIVLLRAEPRVAGCAAAGAILVP